MLKFMKVLLSYILMSCIIIITISIHISASDNGLNVFDEDSEYSYSDDALEASADVTVRAKAYVLMDYSTGQVLMSSNEHERLYPASVTKIMSLLLVCEAIDSGKIKLSDTVTASTNAASKGGSQIWLREGEQMTVDDLLKSTAVYSANDACTALGEYVAGSDEAFVQMMNERASQLGMKETHFDNCTGLDDETDTHLTSAYDVALMSRELLKHDLILNYTTIWMDSVRGGETELVNTNKLIRFYKGATGLKTGTTNKAGCCVSATAKRDSTHLIAVVMGSENSSDRFEGAKSLLNWGFANYTTIVPKIDDSLITPVKIIKGVEEYVTPETPAAKAILVPKGKENAIEQEVKIAVDAQAPVEKGQKLGSIILRLDGETVGEYDLTSPKEIAKLTVGTVFARLLKLLAE